MTTMVVDALLKFGPESIEVLASFPNERTA